MSRPWHGACGWWPTAAPQPSNRLPGGNYCSVAVTFPVVEPQDAAEEDPDAMDRYRFRAGGSRPGGHGGGPGVRRVLPQRRLLLQLPAPLPVGDPGPRFHNLSQLPPRRGCRGILVSGWQRSPASYSDRIQPVRRRRVSPAVRDPGWRRQRPAGPGRNPFDLVSRRPPTGPVSVSGPSRYLGWCATATPCGLVMSVRARSPFISPGRSRRPAGSARRRRSIPHGPCPRGPDFLPRELSLEIRLNPALHHTAAWSRKVGRPGTEFVGRLPVF